MQHVENVSIHILINLKIKKTRGSLAKKKDNVFA